MAFQKNQILTLSIESLSNDGSGVAHHDGQAVFVAAAAPGDVAEVRIVKPMKGYAFGKLEKLLTPGPGRVKQDCPVAGPCGGCGLRHISYAAECAAKTQFVRDAFERLAKLDVPVHEVLGAPAADRYRNKVQLPVGTDENGHLVTGFFAGRSHRIVPCADCKLQPDWMNALAARACTLLEENGITAYNEETHTGRVRHLYMRQGWHSGQRLLCFVVNGNGLPNEAEICEALQKEFDLTTILINRNNARTNVILGAKTRVALGPGYIEDTLSGDQRFACCESCSSRTRNTDRPFLGQCQFFFFSVCKLNGYDRFVDRVFSIHCNFQHSTGNVRRNHGFVDDCLCFLNFCDDRAARNKFTRFYGDMCLPFFLRIQRINADTTADVFTGGFCNLT